MTPPASTIGLRVDRIVDVFARDATDDTLGQLHDFVFAFHDRLDPDAVDRAAILLVDDHVLRHVVELARHVAGVGRLQRGIGETLAGAVRRDEVFENGEALAEVRDNRALDDFA